MDDGHCGSSGSDLKVKHVRYCGCTVDDRSAVDPGRYRLALSELNWQATMYVEYDTYIQGKGQIPSGQ